MKTTALHFMKNMQRQIRGDTHVGGLAKITRWDAATMTVDVQPLVQEKGENDGDYVSAAPCIELPAGCLLGREMIIRAPYVGGDVVQLTTMDQDMDAQLDGEEAPPATDRQHALEDSVAGLGVLPKGKTAAVPDDSLIFATLDGETHIYLKPNLIDIKSKDIKIEGDEQIEGDISIKGDIDITGDLNIHGDILINGHVVIHGSLTVNGKTIV